MGRCTGRGSSRWLECKGVRLSPDPFRVEKGRAHVPTPIPSPASGEGSSALFGL